MYLIPVQGRDRPMCYPVSSVGLFKKSALARAVAFALLLWTAIDVTNANVCALDQEGAFPQAGRVAVASDPGSVPASAPTHSDDCFCCSHCVKVSSLMSLPTAGAFVRLDASRRTAVIHSLYRSLDRPPQILS